MSKYLTVVFVAMILLCAFAPTPAKANSIDTFVFQTCAGPVPSTCGVGGSFNNTYTWQAPAPLTPTTFTPIGQFIDFTIAADVGTKTIDFYCGCFSIFGAEAFTIYDVGNRFATLITSGSTATGVTPWIGPASSPTFFPGSYEFFPDFGPGSGPTETLTISSATGVPEPSALLQTGAGLLVGLAVIAFWLREPASATCS
jgi:hypothetical protein